MAVKDRFNRGSLGEFMIMGDDFWFSSSIVSILYNNNNVPVTFSSCTGILLALLMISLKVDNCVLVYNCVLGLDFESELLESESDPDPESDDDEVPTLDVFWSTCSWCTLLLARLKNADSI